MGQELTVGFQGESPQHNDDNRQGLELKDVYCAPIFHIPITFSRFF